MTTKKIFEKQFTRLISFLVLIVSILALGSCLNNSVKDNDEVTTEDVKEEVTEAADTTAAYLAVKREEALNQYEDRMKALADQITEMQQNIANTRSDIQMTYKQVIDSLQYRQKQTRIKLDTLRSSTDEAWKELKKGFDKALDDLDKAVEDAEKKFE